MLRETLNKGISTPIAISIILILVILVGGFTWWQYGEIQKEETQLPEMEIPEKEEVKDEIADWKSYTNKEHGFRIDYPEGWKIEMPNPQYVTFTSKSEEKQFAIYFSTGIESLDAYLSKAEVFVCSREDTICVNPTFFNKTDIKIDNLDGVQYQMTYDEISYKEFKGLVKLETYILKENTMYLLKLSHWGINEIKSEDLDFYNQTLSTFRFIEEDETGDLGENQLKLWSWEIEELKKKGLQDPVKDLKSDLIKHSELIPYEGTLGGKMGFYSEDNIWVLTKKWVLASFEDGHIGGYMLLEYTVSDGGEISWKVVASYLD